MHDGFENQDDVLNRSESPIYIVLNGIVWIGQTAAWLIIPILILVLMGVTLSAAKIGTIYRWETDLVLFGSKFTLASIGDLQWHLFGVMLMLSLAATIIKDRHVRVDFLRQNFSQKTKDIIDIIGHLTLLIPLCVIVILHSYEFTERSFLMDEGSDYDGLYDRFILKSFIPIGFTLICASAVCLVILKLYNLVIVGKNHD